MKNYNVEFIGLYYNLYTCVEADNEELAENVAIAEIIERYGWDLTNTYSQIEITETEDNE